MADKAVLAFELLCSIKMRQAFFDLPCLSILWMLFFKAEIIGKNTLF